MNFSSTIIESIGGQRGKYSLIYEVWLDLLLFWNFFSRTMIMSMSASQRFRISEIPIFGLEYSGQSRVNGSHSNKGLFCPVVLYGLSTSFRLYSASYCLEVVHVALYIALDLSEQMNIKVIPKWPLVCTYRGIYVTKVLSNRIN